VLASIVVPGTDRDVVSNYATLAERAKVSEFGLLDDDVVVIDTETTGLDFRSCELIEVSAARLRGREVVDTFDVLVKPAQPIPAEIVAITGIDNDMVADAEDAATVTRRFLEFAQDAPLVAHNATFDRHFMEKGNGGRPLGLVWVDSLELSRIVLPCLKSHKLHDLSRAFDLHQSTHRALDDVIATCGLWRILLTAAADLPAGLLNKLAEMYPDTPWSYRPVFAQLAAAHPGAPFSLVDARAERCGRVDVAARPDALEAEAERPLLMPTADEVAAEFTAQGAVGRMYEGYEPRAEQVQMARAVAEAFGTNGYLAVEAGTGVGKSIAYLMPAALLAQRNNITVGIATKSNTLTDQLINRELPLLSRALEKPLTYTALKGFDNYPCLRKVDRLLRRGFGKALPAPGDADDPEAPRSLPAPSEDLLNALAAVLAHSSQSAFGDINTLGIRWGKLQRGDLTSTAAECQKRRCPFFPGRCFLHLARRRAGACDVVVTNHSLLFRQVGSDIEVLPNVRYWVVDEAHSAEAEARRQWARRVNSRDVAAAFDVMGGTNTGALGVLFREVRAKPAATLMLGLLTKTSSECARASIAGGLFFEDLKRFCKKSARRQSYETETVWLDGDTRYGTAFHPVLESGEKFAEALDGAVKAAREAVAALLEESAGDQGLADRVNELAAATSDLQCVHEALRLVLDGRDEAYVYSASATQRTGFEAYELVAERLDVGGQLAQVWYPQTSSVVYSSATIAVGEKFDHFAHEVGLDRLEGDAYRSLRLDSSYDFENNMHVVVTPDLPDPAKQKDEYLEALAPLLADVHLAMGGSVLTLFTNRAEMDRMYELVQPVLAQHGLELASQSRGSNVRRLRDHFIAEKTSSLFALKSFWEGFDAQGDTLRCVVIPRLPFTPPTDPLSQERRLREGKDAWRNHDLPESVLSMKQAAGRLIRSSSDRGVLLLADPRLKTMWYGRVFLASLPKREYETVEASRVRAHLEAWNEASGASW
jgi:ATP-dependent DNA helicase DinG